MSSWIAGVVVFSLFFIEAVLHYNLGHNKGKALHEFEFSIPNLTDSIKIAATVVFFAVLSVVITKVIEKNITKVIEKNKAPFKKEETAKARRS